MGADGEPSNVKKILLYCFYALVGASLPYLRTPDLSRFADASLDPPRPHLYDANRA